MKTIIKTSGAALLLACAALTASCSKFQTEESPVMEELQQPGELTVSFDGIPTKAVGQTKSSEDAINNVSIFIFRTDAGLKTDASIYKSFSPANTQAGSGTPCQVTLKCTTGSRKVYVVANAASDLTETVKCEADLLAMTTLLKDNGLSNFFMMGCSLATVTEGSCTVSVPISRYVASVRLDKITNLMDAKAYRAEGLFVVNAIYLTNVVGKMDYNKTTDPSALASEYWHARLNAEDNALFYDGDLNATVDYGEAKARNIVHNFYAFPNSCALSESATWGQRSTMLVIEATLDGVKYYYPVAVGPLESNKQYVITNFIIRRPGTNNPWECIHKSDATIEISVTDWGNSATTTEDL